MSRPRPADRNRKIDDGTRVPVGLAVLSQEDGYILCSCGQPFTQRRRKVREEAAQRHLDSKHEGRGIWL